LTDASVLVFSVLSWDHGSLKGKLKRVDKPCDIQVSCPAEPIVETAQLHGFRKKSPKPVSNFYCAADIGEAPAFNAFLISQRQSAEVIYCAMLFIPRNRSKVGSDWKSGSSTNRSTNYGIAGSNAGSLAVAIELSCNMGSRF
jgi:hypothetical protein